MHPKNRDPFDADLSRFVDQLNETNFQSIAPGLGFGRVRRPEDLDKYQSDPFVTGVKHNPFAGEVVDTQTQFAAEEIAPLVVRDVAQEERALVPPQKPKEVDLLAGMPELDPEQERLWRSLPEQPDKTAQMPEQVGLPSTEAPREPVAPLPHPNRDAMFIRFCRFCVGHSIDITMVTTSLVVALVVAGYFFAPKGANGFAQSLAQWVPVKLLLGLGVLQFGVAVYGLFLMYWVFFKLFAGATIGQTLVNLFRRRI